MTNYQWFGVDRHDLVWVAIGHCPLVIGHSRAARSLSSRSSSLSPSLRSPRSCSAPPTSTCSPATPPWRERAEEGGDFEGTDGRRVRWRAEIEPAGVADLFAVTFTCELTEAGTGRVETVTEVFRLLRPTWSEELERETLRAEARDRILKLQGRVGGTNR